MSDSIDGIHTRPSEVDLSAKTIGTEGNNKDRLTLRTEVSQAEPASQDTSAGAAGQTHFKTVSDGEVREGYFSKDDSERESPWKRLLSIAVLTIALLGGTALLVQAFKEPEPDALLAKIDQDFEAEGSSFALQQQYEQFLKLFPEHPRADEINDRRLAYRVESAVRRLRRNRKFRSGESPLFETEFLAAMELRESDPQAASEKLKQWVTIFHDSTVEEDDARAALAELATFESNRLTNLEPTTPAVNPKLAELLDRIRDAKSLGTDERRAVLQGIVERYDRADEAWAKQAVEAARAALDLANEESEVQHRRRSN